MHIFFALGCVFMVFAMIRLFPKMVAITLVGGTVLAIVGAAILIPFGLWWSKLGDDYVKQQEALRQQQIEKVEDPRAMVSMRWVGDRYVRDPNGPARQKSENEIWMRMHGIDPSATPRPDPVPNFEREDQSSKTLYVGK